MVYQVAQTVKIPIMGLGGIVSAEDAIEFLLAGASTISIGSGNFLSPYTSIEVIDGIETYLKQKKIEDIKELIGSVQMN